MYTSITSSLFENNRFSVNLTNLRQNSIYAYYITSLVSFLDNKRGDNMTQSQSEVKYFETPPAIPTSPVVTTLSKTNSSILLTWHPISSMHEDLVESYCVDIFHQPDDIDKIDERNYCLHPKVIDDGQNRQPPRDKYSNYECCKDEDTVLEMDYLSYLGKNPNDTCGENDQHCSIFYEYLRFRKEFSAIIKDIEFEYRKPTNEKREYHPKVPESYFTFDNYLTTLCVDSKNRTVMNITNLLPYHLYTFHFFACNNLNGCGPYHMYNDRTDGSQNGDDINLIVDKEAIVDDGVFVRFQPPYNPSGITVSYEIEWIHLIDRKYGKKCVPRKQIVANKYT